jgi:putative membrane protein
MVTDHTAANQELMALAQAKNLTVPAEMNEHRQKMEEALARKQGDNFDREYMRHMVNDHEKAVQLFSKEAQDGKDPALKDFAAKTLPTLQEHLQMARDLAQQQGLSQVR